MKDRGLSPKIRNKMSGTLTTSVQQCNGGSSQCNKEGKKKKKGFQIGKEEIKEFLFADVMSYLENFKESTPIRINKFGKFTGYKISIQKMSFSGASTVAQRVKNLTSIHEDVSSIPGLSQWVCRSSVAASLDPALLWLYRIAWQLQLQFDP